ncbi:ribose-phosphate pyrophosphokinase [Leucobacter sp. CSA1]|uniref:RNA pseudouridylate synthase n=1 Tax=Leucobacter chromiisoli TaxID=2796471 RepID=A0A934UUI7_9MICO|nr:pseudouridine synthase [Leucobacter chromiisoli]MBK0417977.1 ribose-phosphate pyrophosphokinase [Leucobacter chromiisoli]
MAAFEQRFLPPRDGISAARLRAPGGRRTHAGAHLPVPATVGAWLAETVIPSTLGREQAFGAMRLTPEYFVTDGALTTEGGERAALADPVEPGGIYSFHKPVPHEPRIPFEVAIVYEDEDLLVVDKPAFLASTPNGKFVRECVVTRLRAARGEDSLVAIHRLDRVTSGLLILSRRGATRGAYQSMFQRREVRKTYRALAWLPPAWRPGDPLPLGLAPGAGARYRISRLEKEGGTRAVLETLGEPNARTSIELLRVLRHAGRWAGEFLLRPHTGKTHQLRVHMNALGMPLLGDPVYPVDLAPDPYDFSSTLQLLAERLAFADPLTGEERAFESGLRLDPRSA